MLTPAPIPLSPPAGRIKEHGRLEEADRLLRLRDKIYGYPYRADFGSLKSWRAEDTAVIITADHGRIWANWEFTKSMPPRTGHLQDTHDNKMARGETGSCGQRPSL